MPTADRHVPNQGWLCNFQGSAKSKGGGALAAEHEVKHGSARNPHAGEDALLITTSDFTLQLVGGGI